uniref:Uncharacterized protein n=1 Tax=Anguilla anguilla TaxID=7936 RepID=A0A0E9VWV3_ANGAN
MVLNYNKNKKNAEEPFFVKCSP